MIDPPVPLDEVEQQLATGLGEVQIAEFVEDDKVHPGQMDRSGSAVAASASLPTLS
jgi:hypothetical protein